MFKPRCRQLVILVAQVRYLCGVLASICSRVYNEVTFVIVHETFCRCIRSMSLAVIGKRSFIIPSNGNDLRLNSQPACGKFNFVVVVSQAAWRNGEFTDIAVLLVIDFKSKFASQDIAGFFSNKSVISNTCASRFVAIDNRIVQGCNLKRSLCNFESLFEPRCRQLVILVAQIRYLCGVLADICSSPRHRENAFIAIFDTISRSHWNLFRAIVSERSITPNYRNLLRFNSQLAFDESDVVVVRRQTAWNNDVFANFIELHIIVVKDNRII